MTAPKYDVFLSHKNLIDGVETADARLARDIYHFLSAKGLRVFLSSISLQQQGQAAFQRAIDEALESADVLVAVGTSKENLESRWVRKEWESFENDIASDIKPLGRIFSYVDRIKAIKELPRTLRNNQVIFHKPQDATASFGELYQFIAGNAVAAPSPNQQPSPAKPPEEPAPQVRMKSSPSGPRPAPISIHRSSASVSTRFTLACWRNCRRRTGFLPCTCMAPA